MEQPIHSSVEKGVIYMAKQNKKMMTDSEFQMIKLLIEAGITPSKIFAATGRSVSTINRIKRATDYANYRESLIGLYKKYPSYNTLVSRAEQERLNGSVTAEQTEQEHPVEGLSLEEKIDQIYRFLIKQ